MAMMFLALKPAMAHEHCELKHNHAEHHLKQTASAEIPDAPRYKGELVRVFHQATCGFMSKMPVRHCDMGDCYLKCGGSSGPTASQNDAENEMAPLESLSIIYEYGNSKYSASPQESPSRISIPPEQRPPSA